MWLSVWSKVQIFLHMVQLMPLPSPNPHHLLPHLNPDLFYLSGTSLQTVFSNMVFVFSFFHYFFVLASVCQIKLTGSELLNTCKIPDHVMLYHPFVFFSEYSQCQRLLYISQSTITQSMLLATVKPIPTPSTFLFLLELVPEVNIDC